ncbi:MAG: DNA cytosine methyltransferase [Streptococcaceae bacterium]|jgi:DNA (cytosine-5)-methyltransferase 1|nr:DNA cytosine methyltransferase [Streptococcaceae bacterium]
MKKYKTIDLFAGIGGIRKGFELTGSFENVLSAEIDSYAVKTYEHLYQENPLNDVTSEDFKKKAEGIKYDTLLGGFPCQAFSRAGNQLGFLDSTRGTLFFDTADIIKRTRPKTLLLENVDNLLSHDKGHTFKTILNVLIKDLNYHIIGAHLDPKGNIQFERSSFIRNSKNFGVPQNRPRVYIMGFDKGYFSEKQLELIPDDFPQKSDLSLYEDLDDLLTTHVDPKYYLARDAFEALKKHKERHVGKGNGFGYQIVNEVPGKAYSNAILATGGSGKERNLVIDRSENYSGMTLKSKKSPINSEFVRNMTPEEWGKLQGFIGFAFKDKTGKDNFSFPDEISDTQKYKQFGNSVTIPAIYQMAKFMKNILIEMEELDGE